MRRLLTELLDKFGELKQKKKYRYKEVNTDEDSEEENEKNEKKENNQNNENKV